MQQNSGGEQGNVAKHEQKRMDGRSKGENGTLDSFASSGSRCNRVRTPLDRRNPDREHGWKNRKERSSAASCTSQQGEGKGTFAEGISQNSNHEGARPMQGRYQVGAVGDRWGNVGKQM